MSAAPRGRLVSLAAFLVTLVYLLPFRSYGLNLEDEGVILSVIERFRAGELPYVDFVSGYTPGFFYLTAPMWWLAGNLPMLRTELALVHATAAAGLVLLALRVATPALAFVVGLLCLAFIPVFPGEFAAFNIPYPVWFATVAWIATALALVAFVRGGRRGWLIVAGVATAVAFAIKPNAGVFALAASVAAVLLVAGPEGTVSRGSALLWYGCWSGLLVGPWLTLGTVPGARDALVYLGPMTAALLALPTRARTHRAGLTTDLLILGATFAVTSLPWVLYFWLRLGPERFLRDVLYVGSEFPQLYYVPYPAFEPWALLLTAAVVGFGGAGFGLRRGWLRPRQVAIVALLGLVLSGIAIARFGVMPERTVQSIIWQLESAGFPLALAAQAIGVVWLWGRRSDRASDGPATLLLCALFMHLQLFPRADFMHLLAAVPLTVVFGAFLLARVLGWWRTALPAPWDRMVAPLTVATVAGVLVLRVAPGVSACALERGPVLPFAVAPVGVERARSGDFVDLGAAATRLAALVPPGGASLAFPALDVALFLTGTRNPTPHSYFFPGRPDHREEAEIVDALLSARLPALVTTNAGFTFFDAAPPYYFLLRRFVRERYVLAERDGRYDVLARADGGVPATGALRPSPDASVEGVPALLLAATGDDVVARRAAVARLADRLEREPAEGLEAWVARAGLDRRREVLLLRTIRDLREERAASYLFVAAASPDPRIANEALGAMYVTRAQMIARRHVWAGPAETAVWPGRDALLAAVRRVLADPAAAPRATAFAAELAGALDARDTAPSLHARLAADAATAASAAAALARLAPGGLACDLLPLLGRTEVDLMALMPTTVLALAESDGPIGAEARACLRRGLASSGPERESVIWTAAALGDPAFGPAFRAALAADAPRVRRAAAWALGELPSSPEGRTALVPLAERDGDTLTREIAARAIAKIDGRLARAVAGGDDRSGS